MSNTIYNFYEQLYGDMTPLTQTVSDTIKEQVENIVKTDDMALRSAVIKDGKLYLTVANSNGEIDEVAVDVTPITSDSYTKTESDAKYVDKTDAYPEYDTMKEVGDAIKDIKDVKPYEEDDIKKWFEQ